MAELPQPVIISESTHTPSNPDSGRVHFAFEWPVQLCSENMVRRPRLLGLLVFMLHVGDVCNDSRCSTAAFTNPSSVLVLGALQHLCEHETWRDLDMHISQMTSQNAAQYRASKSVPSLSDRWWRRLIVRSPCVRAGGEHHRTDSAELEQARASSASDVWLSIQLLLEARRSMWAGIISQGSSTRSWVRNRGQPLALGRM